MIKNYEKLPNGIIRQKRISKYKSGLIDYKAYYDKLGDMTHQMSFLRLGYMLGVINKPRTLLDVGYGNGSFLKVASKSITHCYGFDINDYPLPAHVNRVNSLTSRKYDVITFFDSLEHFTNINFVRDLNCSVIVVSVPECVKPNNAEWFSMWKHRKPDEHLFHFSRKALLQFMAESGFSCLSISNVEDVIRGKIGRDPNILTGVFQKIDLTH